MRKDIILTTTQGVRGQKKHHNVQGMTKISVQKGFNESCNSITIDGFAGLGHTYEQRETALINIEFADGTFWSGDFADLRQIILSHKSATA